MRIPVTDDAARKPYSWAEIARDCLAIATIFKVTILDWHMPLVTTLPAMIGFIVAMQFMVIRDLITFTAFLLLMLSLVASKPGYAGLLVIGLVIFAVVSRLFRRLVP